MISLRTALGHAREADLDEAAQRKQLLALAASAPVPEGCTEFLWVGQNPARG